ncbi:hypothetical protein [Carnobacterium maltaromaticum]|uniref:hypothetical protein n=1 Tax=Carnobacterium maltaromaticum TaxID=2751 RepID=UPI0012F721E3|nr:hypothetical protein [Carnobacterium maltaromaticum]
MISNAKITKTTLGYEDHGILTLFIHVKGDGWGVAIGGYSLDDYSKESEKRIATRKGLELIAEILSVIGVQNWEDLKGKNIRVDLSEGLGGKVKKIGNLIEDKWIDFEEFFKNEGGQKL